jgi:protein-tyrosine phosphatase
MIDLHCHVLPGVDDGPATVEESIALAREAHEDGTTTIAATPHVDWIRPQINARLVRDAVTALQGELDAAGVGVRIVPGGEVASTRAIELDDDELRALTLGGGAGDSGASGGGGGGGTSGGGGGGGASGGGGGGGGGWLLLECPLDATVTPGFVEIARMLARRGHRLLLAHPERCPLFLRGPQLLDELVAEGMLAQVTAGALSGLYGRTVRDAAFRMVDTGAAHVVASDGHGGNRPAKIAGELTGTGLDPALIRWLTDDVPAALLAGEAPPPRPPVEPRPSRRRRIPLLRH